MTSEYDKKTLDEAMDRFDQALEASNEFRKHFKEDLKFASGDQWDQLAKQQRTESSRPCLTMDFINPALRQIVNEERQNRPAIQVNPTGGGATEDIGLVLAGMIRHIEQDSSADQAYDTAGWYAAAGGIGYIRLCAKYESIDSFNQKLCIETVADPMNVFYDPNSVQPDGSDANWAFIIDTLPKETFERRFPESKMLKEMDDIGGWDKYETNHEEWLDKDSIRVAEYFYKDYKDETLYEIMDHITGEIITTTIKPPQQSIDDGTVEILRQRTIQVPTVKWCVLSSEEILQETIFEGHHIPVIPVYGEDYWVDGKRFTSGAIRKLVDPQKVINFSASAEVELLDLNAKAPYIGAAGQFDSFEASWANANRKNYAYLEYNALDINGNPTPPPQRNTAEAPLQGAQSVKAGGIEAVRSIAGAQDPGSEQAIRSEVSGVAILARKQQQSISNYHYYDNLVRSVRYLGRILVDIIPKYYDTPRMIRIIKPDSQQEMVAINQIHKGKMIDLKLGKYDVVVQTGPSYSTRRQELVESGISLIQAYPQAAPLISDILAQNMDFEGAQQMAKRLRAAVPPEILAASDDEKISPEDAEALVPQLKAQLQQSQQQLQAIAGQHQQLVEALHVANDKSQLEQLKIQVDADKNTKADALARKKLELEEQETELEYLVKEQELKIAFEELKLKKEQLGLQGVKVASDINESIHNHAIEHLDRVSTSVPEDAETGISKENLE